MTPSASGASGAPGLWLVLALSGLAFGSFSWGVLRHFAGRAQPAAGMRLLSACSVVAWLGFVVVAARMPPWPAGDVIGGLLFLGGLLLFWWTIAATRRRPPRLAFADDAPDALFSHGPYAFIRHPFYLSYILFWIGTAVTPGLWWWAPVGLMFVVAYAGIARREEARFMASAMSDHYLAYRRRTGMLLPRVFRSSPAGRERT
jgi:protein-S-isoprenylcysteine O-methyltransferase Ste14